MDFSFFTDGRLLLWLTIGSLIYYFYLVSSDSNE
jgi:hypothetical protein